MQGFEEGWGGLRSRLAGRRARSEAAFTGVFDLDQVSLEVAFM